MSSISVSSPRTTTSANRGLWHVGLLTAVVTSAVNVLLGELGRRLFDVPDAFRPLRSTSPLIVTSIVAVAGAIVVLALLTRVTRRPRRMFQVVAAAFVTLSLLGPLSQIHAPGASAGAIATLIAMHLVSAAIIVTLLPMGLQVASGHGSAGSVS